jgi:amino acid adenylation domain-containing protein
LKSLSDLIFDKAEFFKSQVAIKIGNREITYQELNNKALNIAAALVAEGITNETVGLVGQRKASYYFGILGILYAGCHYCPINPKYNASRIKAIIESANIRFLIGDSEDLLKLETTLGIDDFSASVIVPEGKIPARKRWFGEGVLDRTIPIDRPVISNSENLSYLLFTSGSTGTPKGVKVTHSNITSFLMNMASIYKLEPGFKASQTFDFSFDPSVSDMFFTWSQGGQLCVLPEEELMLPSEYIRREKIVYWNSVPSLAVFMNKMGKLTKNCFPDLKFSMFCGEQFPKYIADIWRLAAPNSTIENLYGPTEGTIYISRYLYKSEDTGKIFRNSVIPIGQPFPNHEVAIVDDSGRSVIQGETGEICFKGKQITNGYLNDSVKTNLVFVNFEWDSICGKWYKTGDLGFVNKDGNVECIGRRDNQIKIAGRRIEIGEIEAVLAKFPAIFDAVVVPVRDANDIVTGCVAFTMNNLSKEEENLIRNETLTFIERVFFPKKIFTIGSFPLTSSGKTDRKALEVLVKELIFNKDEKI